MYRIPGFDCFNEAAGVLCVLNSSIVFGICHSSLFFYQVRCRRMETIGFIATALAAAQRPSAAFRQLTGESSTALATLFTEGPASLTLGLPIDLCISVCELTMAQTGSLHLNCGCSLSLTFWPCEHLELETLAWSRMLYCTCEGFEHTAWWS